jgi:preprotein translocase subunit YajC
MQAVLHQIALIAQKGGTDNTSTTPAYTQLIFFLLIGAVFYLFLIRPQQRQRRAQRELVQALEVGDEVVTSSGIFGIIRELDDEAATLEVSPGTQIRVLRGFIARRITEPEPEEQEEEDQEAGESS